MEKADVRKDGWSSEELGEQSSYEDTNEMSRRLRRGDETRGDPNTRDVAGATPEEDTPQGRNMRERTQGSLAENRLHDDQST